VKNGYGQFCPLAMACEVFAARWTPIILRELFAGSHRFNEIHRAIPLISRTLLVTRLRELEAAGVIAEAPSASGNGREYRLTEAGEEFRDVLAGLATWGQRWTDRARPENLNAGVFMWILRRRIAADRLPARRVVVYFNFTGIPASYRGNRKFWLILERSAIDVCVRDPGFEVDLFLDADLATMVKVHLGDLAFAEALRARQIRMRGMPGVIRQFPSWLLLSAYAKVPRPETGVRPSAARQARTARQ
jgi:DNA-binding HxlR family transcriptional regulator